MALKLSAVFRHTAQEALKCRSWVPKAIFQGLSRDVGFRVRSLLILYFDRESMFVCGAVCFFPCSGVVGALRDLWTGSRPTAKRLRGKQQEAVEDDEKDVQGWGEPASGKESQVEEDGNDESGMQEEGEEEQEKEQDPSIDPEGDEAPAPAVAEAQAADRTPAAAPRPSALKKRPQQEQESRPQDEAKAPDPAPAAAPRPSASMSSFWFV